MSTQLARQLRQEVATDRIREGEGGWSFERYKISSDRPNTGLWIVRPGRSEAG